MGRLAPIMESCDANIADFNCALVKELASILDLTGLTFQRARKMSPTAQGAETIFEILEKKIGASIYLTAQGTGS